MYPSEDFKIGFIYEMMGKEEEAKPYFELFREYCERNESVYKEVSLAALYAHDGDYDRAMKHLKAFALEDNVQYWVVLFLDLDPVLRKMAGHPDYDATMQKIKDRFWDSHNKLRASLEEEGLI